MILSRDNDYHFLFEILMTKLFLFVHDTCIFFIIKFTFKIIMKESINKMFIYLSIRVPALSVHLLRYTQFLTELTHCMANWILRRRLCLIYSLCRE